MSPLGVVISIVLVDLMGFTMVMPLLPRFAEEYHASGFQIGLLMAGYPLLQLLAGPVLGRLSDRWGRRPVLIVSQAGTAISFVILGLSRNFTVLLLARMLDGASGGNILVAQAYVADVTKPEHRARNLGLIGAAFGVGFVLGPLLASALLALPVPPEWRLRVPFLVAAGFSTLAWIMVALRLPESLPPRAEGRQAARVVSWAGLLKTVAEPKVRLLVAIGALTVFGFAALEGTFSLYLEDCMGWDAGRAARGFALLGFVSAMVQGGLIRRLVPRFGEPKMIIAGTCLLALGLAGFGVVPHANLPALIGASIVVGIGHGLASPTIQGLLSRVTPPDDQGGVFGTLTSAQTLARLVNYLVGNSLLARYGPAAPYWEASAVVVVALLLALWVGRLLPSGSLAAGEHLSAAAPVDAAKPAH